MFTNVIVCFDETFRGIKWKQTPLTTFMLPYSTNGTTGGDESNSELIAEALNISLDKRVCSFALGTVLPSFFFSKYISNVFMNIKVQVQFSGKARCHIPS